MYLHCIGRTPKVKPLKVSGDMVLVRELTIGNPMELEKMPQRTPYWVCESDLYARLRVTGGRYTLSGKPDLSKVPREFEDRR